MFRWVEHKFYPRLENKEFKSNDELYAYLLTQVAVLFAIVMHAILFIIMMVTGIPVLIVASGVSFVLFVVNFKILLHKKIIQATALILAADVITYTLIITVCIGSDNYCIFYLIVLMILQVILPYAKPWVRISVLFLIWLCMMLLLLIPQYQQPLYDIGAVKPVLSIFNIQLGFAGVTIELLIGDLLRKVIADFNARRFANLESEANTDPLTGLYNRRYSQEAFERIAEDSSGNVFCTAMLDIDDFKQINDQYGHSTGDLVLQTLADTMRRELRKTDLMFRWGGEEFLIILENVDTLMAYTIMDELRISLSEATVMAGDTPIHFTVTIGLTVLDTDNITESIEQSDKLLYVGKRNGKNRVVA